MTCLRLIAVLLSVALTSQAALCQQPAALAPDQTAGKDAEPEKKRPVTITRRHEFTDEDLRKQLQAVPEVGLNQTGAAALYGQLPNSKTSSTRVPASRLPSSRQAQLAAAIPPDVGFQVLTRLAAQKQQPSATGISWRMGPDCQMGKEPAERLQVLSTQLRAMLRACVPAGDIRPDAEQLRGMLTGTSKGPATTTVRKTPSTLKAAKTNREEWTHAEAIPTLTQMLQAENTPIRLLLVELLANINGRDASVALAKRAIFDLSPEVREKAVQALADRPAKEYLPTLLSGFGWPLPAIADHAAEAVIAIAPNEAGAALINVGKRLCTFLSKNGPLHIFSGGCTFIQRSDRRADDGSSDQSIGWRRRRSCERPRQTRRRHPR